MSAAETVAEPAISSADRGALLAFLVFQREAALDVVAGLTERDLRRSVVPSGWTPLGLVEHLAHAERFWGQRVLRGTVVDRPWDDVPTDSAWTSAGHAVADVLAFYRGSCERTDANLAAFALDDTAFQVARADLPTDVGTVRELVLHLIEETARHAGHLDIARELLDGRTGLGPR